jgi:hypothetical protein
MAGEIEGQESRAVVIAVIIEAVMHSPDIWDHESGYRGLNGFDLWLRA